MKKLFLALSLVLVTACSQQSPEATKAPQQSLLQPVAQDLLLNEILVLEPVANHHFNLKAPQKCSRFPMTELTARKIQCQLLEPGEHEMTVSICDNAESFCKLEKFKIQVKNPNRVAAAARKEGAPPVYYAPKTESLPVPKGFIQNDPQKAQSLAQAQSKLLLIDFYGVWCPPCNYFDEYVFNEPAFVTATADIVKSRIDVDSDLSWGWKTQFSVTGYPTLVLARVGPQGQLEEIGRLVGFRPLKVTLKWLADQKKLRDRPVSVVKAELSGKDRLTRMDDFKRVGLWYFDRGEFTEAIHYLKSAAKKDREADKALLISELKVAEEKSDDKLTEAALDHLIKRHADAPEFGRWVTQLFDFNPQTAKTYLAQARKSFSDWRASPRLEEFDYIPGELWQFEADLLETADLKEEAKKAFAEGARYYAQLAQKSSLKTARGAGLEQAYCLVKAGQFEEAKKIYEKMVESYGNEFTFNYYYAWALQELKQYDQARKYVEKAEANSYGDNWLRAVGMKAKIDLARNDPKTAEQELKKALDQVVPPPSAKVRSHRYISQLRKLLSEAQSKKGT